MYNNCLIGVIWIALTCPIKGKIKMIWPNHRWCPHFVYDTIDGMRHHFKLKRDILPSPLCYLLFEGTFVAERKITS